MNLENPIIIGYEAKRIYHNKTGLGNYCRDLIRILSTNYSNNSYFLYNPKKSDKNLFGYSNNNCIEKRPKNKIFQYFYNLWRQYFVVNDLINDNVNIYHGLSGELPFGLQSTAIKSVVTIHDLIFLHHPHFYKWIDRKIYTYKFKKAAQNADKIIAISEQTKSDIMQFFKIKENKIEVIYQGCHNIFKEKSTDSEKIELLKKLDLPETFILNVGTIEARKNIFQVVKAIKDTSIPLVILGKKTKYCLEIEQYISDNQMNDQVFFINGLSHQELATLYQLATLFVYPSLFEGFGIPIIEALYSKVPVITSKDGVFPEAGGPFSAYIDPNNCDEIKDKILELWNSSEKRAYMVEKSFEFVQKFNDPIIAKQVMDLYQALVSND
ncbi:glycosyltransferase family 4 protein [Flavobacterium branchiophilum]|uniref:Glycosyltransferase involved in cell wall biosynthesis n=1 Tax=Flavobacterium branchiophilum TaxID=55197 RepID=A0A543G7W6_9FLAO|nr:glycosyltransferase family 1 protein [Flavobacterium branchiophilum]TQM42044.1 glycosyltransferase involved in cell wall biosynthesis [Flavobacterium branchiophilum]GEM53815.1 glycosyl transferase family 1 [Flavobacterium branchiophilum NBRC 15030 = ATCC 35035]